MNNKTGILTVHHNTNYGANLQAFASCHFINSLGYHCQIINHISKSQEINSHLLGWLMVSWRNEPNKSLKRKLKLGTALLLSAPQKYARLRNFRKFRAKHCRVSPVCKNSADVSRLGFDTVICGSDQIWNPDITGGINPLFFGEIDGVSKRISYAASIGKSEYSAEDAEKVIPLIQNLDYCSVREADSADYLKKLTNRNIEAVCDPVFLLDKSTYDALIKKRVIKQKYVLVYSIVSNPNMLETAKKYAKEHNLKLVEICANKNRREKHAQKAGYGPIEFLNAFKYADTIFTNSFHGTAFSIIFEKDFFVFNNKYRGSRITNLMEKAGLRDYMLDEENPVLPTESINYSAVKANLEEYVSSSKAFLVNALKSEKRPLIKDGCTGCGACKTACRQDAVRIYRNNKGFLKSSIDTQKCVNCNACFSACPIRNMPEKQSAISVYAFKAEDRLRKNSTSGGAFAALAEAMLKNGGAVYGASLNADFSLCHKRITTPEELSMLQGTKYIQSDMTDVFAPLKEDLENHKPVLFSGTPCQIAAVQNFVKREKLNSENVYLCDIICHGVPSPKVFKDYIEWLNGKEQIEKYFFRNKAISWRGDSSSVTTADSQLKHDQNTAAFMNLYYSNNITCDACFDCKFTSKERVGDITVSDFWGIENGHPEFEDGLGVSMVMVNTAKGRRLFEQAEGQKEISDLSFAKQPQLDRPTAKPDEYTEFWSKYQKDGIAYAIKNFGIPKKTLKTIVYNLIKGK